MTYQKIGNTPGHVGMLGSWDHTKYTVEDLGVGFVRLANGASIAIESSFAANIGEDKFCSTLMGTKGGAETSPVRIFAEESGTLIDKTPAYVTGEISYEEEIKGFYEAIRNDTEPPVTAEQALDVIKILDAIYRSSETGKEIVID